MVITLNPSMFVNNVYSIAYGQKVATFTIVQESYAASGNLASIDRMNCDIKTFDSNNNLVSEVLGSLVIGLGDSNVSVTATDTSLLGLLMTAENMASCAVELYD